MTDLRRPHFEEIASSLTGIRETVWRGLHQHGPCTARELTAAMGWKPEKIVTVRARLTELKDSLLMEPTGERRNGEHVFRALTEQQAREKWCRLYGAGQLEMAI